MAHVFFLYQIQKRPLGGLASARTKKSSIIHNFGDVLLHKSKKAMSFIRLHSQKCT